MIFERLGRWVTGNSKKVIAVWILIILTSIYPMMKINEVVVYEEIGMGPSDTEASTAADIIDEQFPAAVPNSSVMVVIQAEDVRSTNVRDFVLSVEEQSGDGRLKYVKDFTSIYSIYRQALFDTVNSTARGIYAVENGVNQTAMLFYGMPANFLSMHNYTNYTASLIYGVPRLHKAVWDGLGHVTNATERDRQAYMQTWDFMQMAFSFGAFPPSESAIIYGYYNLTCDKWNTTRGDPKYLANSSMRAQKSVDDSVSEFADQHFAEPPEAKELLYAIWKNWTVDTWYIELLEAGKNNLPSINRFADGYIFCMMKDMIASQLGGVSDGKSGGIEASDAAVFFNYHNSTMEYWNNATKSYPSASLLPQREMREIMKSAIGKTCPSFINDTYRNDPVGAELAIAVYRNFTMDNYNSTEKIHSVSVEIFRTNLQKSGITFSIQQIEDMYRLGSEPTRKDILAYANVILRNGTVANYPLKLPDVVVSNFINRKGNTMIFTITFTKNSEYTDSTGFQMAENAKILRTIVDDTKRKTANMSLKTFVTGDLALNADLAHAAFKDVEKIDTVTVAMIIALITLFFFSLVTPFVPLMVMGLAIVICQGIIFLVGTIFNGVHYSVTTILFVIIMGAGCDYCIFIIARYREELKNGRDNRDAVVTSVTWAGESIATSGTTVIIGFIALSIGSFSLMRTMGIILALGILVALSMALTLLPALMDIIGSKIFWPSHKLKRRTPLDPKIKTVRRRDGTKRRIVMETYFTRAAKFSIRHAKAIVAVAILITIPTTYLLTGFHTSFDFIGAMPRTESTDGVKALGDGFGEGTIMKNYAVLHFSTPIYDGTEFNREALDASDSVADAILSRADGIERVEISTKTGGTRIDMRNFSRYNEADKNKEIAESIGTDSRTVMITIIFKTEPLSKEAMSEIDDIRAIINEVKGNSQALQKTDIYVGGSTAELRDLQKVTDSDFQKMVIIVIVGIFIVLMIVLGSIFIPMRLILTISLSISWTLALAMFIFEYMRGLPILWLMPMILFIVMMGLGMDYDILLCTRIREEVQKGKNDVDAIITAVEKTGVIITACGAIMAAAFGSMMLSTLGLLQEFGFALCFAILVDAMIIRIYLVPAIMVLLTKWNWWAPGPLQRVKRNNAGTSNEERSTQSKPFNSRKDIRHSFKKDTKNHNDAPKEERKNSKNRADTNKTDK